MGNPVWYLKSDLVGNVFLGLDPWKPVKTRSLFKYQTGFPISVSGPALSAMWIMPVLSVSRYPRACKCVV